MRGDGPILVDTEAAVAWCGRPREVLYRWAREGRLTRHGGRGNGAALWDVLELPQWDGPRSSRPMPAPPAKKLSG